MNEECRYDDIDVDDNWYCLSVSQAIRDIITPSHWNNCLKRAADRNLRGRDWHEKEAPFLLLLLNALLLHPKATQAAKHEIGEYLLTAWMQQNDVPRRLKLVWPLSDIPELSAEVAATARQFILNNFGDFLDDVRNYSDASERFQLARSRVNDPSLSTSKHWLYLASALAGDEPLDGWALVFEYSQSGPDQPSRDFCEALRKTIGGDSVIFAGAGPLSEWLAKAQINDPHLRAAYVDVCKALARAIKDLDGNIQVQQVALNRCELTPSLRLASRYEGDPDSVVFQGFIDSQHLRQLRFRYTTNDSPSESNEGSIESWLTFGDFLLRDDPVLVSIDSETDTISLTPVFARDFARAVQPSSQSQTTWILAFSCSIHDFSAGSQVEFRAPAFSVFVVLSASGDVGPSQLRARLLAATPAMREPTLTCLARQLAADYLSKQEQLRAKKEELEERLRVEIKLSEEFVRLTDAIELLKTMSDLVGDVEVKSYAAAIGSIRSLFATTGKPIAGTPFHSDHGDTEIGACVDPGENSPKEVENSNLAWLICELSANYRRKTQLARDNLSLPSWSSDSNELKDHFERSLLKRAANQCGSPACPRCMRAYWSSEKEVQRGLLTWELSWGVFRRFTGLGSDDVDGDPFPIARACQSSDIRLASLISGLYHLIYRPLNLKSGPLCSRLATGATDNASIVFEYASPIMHKDVADPQWARFLDTLRNIKATDRNSGHSLSAPVGSLVWGTGERVTADIDSNNTLLMNWGGHLRVAVSGNQLRVFFLS